jgi:hypothetical protein
MHRAPATVGSAFVGSLESQTLIPRWDGGGCLESYRGPGPTGDDSHRPMENICVSNSCGWERVRLRSIRMIYGPPVRGELTLTYPIGEWCKPTLALTRDPVLFVVDSYDSASENVEFQHFDLLKTEDGRVAFVPAIEEHKILGIDVVSLLKAGIAPFTNGSIADYSPDALARLSASGFIRVRHDQLEYFRVIYLDDFAQALASNNRFERSRGASSVSEGGSR